MRRRGRASIGRASIRKRVRESAPRYRAVQLSRLLLDTHAWLWWRADDARLGKDARAAIRAAGEVRFSAASAWEIVIKAALGKLEFPRVDRIAAELEQHGFRPLPIELEHAVAVGTLPKRHGDPFDRLLAAQATAEGLTLVTADGVFAEYGISVLDARR